MESYKILVWVVIISALYYAAVWTFNHVDPWVGIGIGLGVTAFLAQKAINKIKKL